MDQTPKSPGAPQTRQTTREILPKLIDILEWVYRHRYVTSEQVRRGFPGIKSDRTARRYLRRLYDEQYLNILPVRDGFTTDYRQFFATTRGLTFVRNWRADEGRLFDGVREDSRLAGKTHVTSKHEETLTDVQIRLEELLREHGGELIATERRFRRPDRKLSFTRLGKKVDFHPDLSILARHRSGGLYPLTLVESDRSTKSIDRLYDQVVNYQHWGESYEGRRYLMDLYRKHGSLNPKPVFRLLIVIHRGVKPAVSEGVRVEKLLKLAEDLPTSFLRDFWLIEGSDLLTPGPQPFWLRPGEVRYQLFD